MKLAIYYLARGEGSSRVEVNWYQDSGVECLFESSWQIGRCFYFTIGMQPRGTLFKLC